MASNKAFAYDIAVENADGVTICYNYINDGKELEVTSKYYNTESYSIYYRERYYEGDIIIPEEVTYMNRTRKVTSIGSAFSYCSTLTSVKIPKSVTNIGNKAFYYCHSLTSLTIPNNVTKIGEEAFFNCYELTSLTIGNSVTDIGAYAFYNCNKLTSISIPNSVKTIGTAAFEKCSKLTSIDIGCGINRIMEGAFNECYNIDKVIIRDIASWCNVNLGLKYRRYQQQKIMDNACANPLSLAKHIYSAEGVEITELIIPEKVDTIKEGAFYNCRQIKSVSFPNTLKYIGKYAFGETGIKKVNIAPQVKEIGEFAFQYCDSLSEIVIPNSVTAIGYEAFFSPITLIRSYIIEPFNVSGVFKQDTQYNATLFVPKGTIEKYKNMWGWKEFLFIEEGTEDNENPINTEVEINGINYKIISDKECEVVPGENYSGDIVIPEKITSNEKEYTVTAISKDAFKKCHGLTSIVIPKSVTYIGEWAFMGTSINSVIIPDGVTTLEESVFNGCDNLSSVTIPNSVTSIGYKAFYRCLSLPFINIPNSVTSIGELAFWECRKLTSITIPNSVTSIGAQAFNGEDEDAPNIQTIISLIENPFEIYGKSSYASNRNEYLGVFTKDIFNNATLYVPKGTINKYKATNGWKDFVYINESNTGETKTYRLTYIVDEVEYKTYELEVGSIITPEPKPTKAGYLFIGWSDIPETMPAHDVIVTGSFIFKSSAYEYDIEVENAEGVTIYYNLINDGSELEVTGKRKENTTWKVYTGSENIPEEVTYLNKTYKVTSIGEGAFFNSQLNSVTIPQSVTSIGKNAFFACNRLTSIIIPSKVTSIGESAFYGCSELTSVIIPPHVTTIGSAAFSGCKAVTSITIPNGVTSISSNTFSGCSSLASIVIPNSVTSIGSSAFSGTAITKVDIPNNVTSIGSDAFNETPWFNNQPDGLVYIKNFAYKYKGEMPQNTTITIIEGTTVICGNAFQNCGNLTSITIPNSLTTIGQAAFYGCTGLSTISIPNTVTSIEAFAFYECSNLNSITIPINVTSIYSWTFYGCTNLSSVTISNNVTTIDTNAFYKCTKLASVIIPNSVTSIGYQAFRDCESLTSVTLGSDLVSINNYIFKGCKALRTVKSYIKEPFSINKFNFEDDTYRQGTLYVLAGTKDLYTRFDGWREFLKIVEMEKGDEQLYLTLQSGSQGKMKLAVKRGENYTLVIEPEDGWSINSVTYNGVDVTSQLDQQNRFTTPTIVDNAILCVTYEQTTQGIRSQQMSKIKVAVSSNNIYISNAQPGSVCRIYSIGGELLESTVLSDGNANLQMPSGHVYIVKVDDNVFKVGM